MYRIIDTNPEAALRAPESFQRLEDIENRARAALGGLALETSYDDNDIIRSASPVAMAGRAALTLDGLGVPPERLADAEAIFGGAFVESPSPNVWKLSADAALALGQTGARTLLDAFRQNVVDRQRLMPGDYESDVQKVNWLHRRSRELGAELNSPPQA